MPEDIEQETSNTAKDEINPDDWIKEQHGVVLRYCSNKSLQISSVLQKKSAVLPPFVAVWLVESGVNKKKFWVISGDLPTDHIAEDIAKSPQEVLRHFSLSWQLKAEKLLQGLAESKPKLADSSRQGEFANLLIDRAQLIYDLSVDETMWR